MSQLNINDLPPELTARIMKFVDWKSLKNAALTCKLWNNLIESTCRWSLVLNGYEKALQKKMNSIQTTKRKIGTIEVENVMFIVRPEINDIFRKHGGNVVKLVLFGGYIDSIGALADLLHLMPNLEHAVVNMVIFRALHDLPSDYVLPDMKKLKKLQWCVCDHRFIQCFRKANLTTMIIQEIERAVHYDLLVEFVTSQDTLTSLTVNNGRSRRSILAEMGKLNAPIPLRLTKLTVDAIHGIGSSFDRDYESLLEFIKSQRENLKQLTIGGNVVTSGYESGPASTKVKISICELPREKDFYAQWQKDDNNVRTIELLGHFNGDVGFLCNFFELVPNVRSLILQDTDTEMNNNILLMAQSLSKLESLSVGAFNESSFGCIKFCNLKALHIGYLSGKIDWDQLTKVHSRLTELSIRVIDRAMFTSVDVDQIVTNVDLQSIKLGGYFRADDRFYEIVQTKCKNLKLLDLCGLYVE